MERETGIEPATSSLGSWHSTAELLPLDFQPHPNECSLEGHYTAKHSVGRLKAVTSQAGALFGGFQTATICGDSLGSASLWRKVGPICEDFGKVPCLPERSYSRPGHSRFHRRSLGASWAGGPSFRQQSVDRQEASRCR